MTQKNPRSLSSNNAWRIFEDKDKNIWIGTYNGGLNLFHPNDHTFTQFIHAGKRPDIDLQQQNIFDFSRPDRKALGWYRRRWVESFQ